MWQVSFLKESEGIYGQYDVLLHSIYSIYLNYSLLNELMLKLNMKSESNSYNLHTMRIFMNDTNIILFDNQCFNFLNNYYPNNQTIYSQNYMPYTHNCLPNIAQFDVCNLTSKNHSYYTLLFFCFFVSFILFFLLEFYMFMCLQKGRTNTHTQIIKGQLWLIDFEKEKAMDFGRSFDYDNDVPGFGEAIVRGNMDFNVKVYYYFFLFHFFLFFYFFSFLFGLTSFSLLCMCVCI